MRAVRVAVSYCYSRCSAEEEEVDRLKSWRSTNFFGESLSKQEKRHYGLLELGFLEKFQTPAPLFILVVSPQTLYHTSSLLASTQESRPFFFPISHSTQGTHCAYRGTLESVWCAYSGQSGTNIWCLKWDVHLPLLWGSLSILFQNILIVYLRQVVYKLITSSWNRLVTKGG